MTNKQKFLKAVDKTIEQYRKNKYAYRFDNCAFCRIVKKKYYADSCIPCPMAVKYRECGCMKFNSLLRIINASRRSPFIPSQEAFKYRIQFHIKYLKPLIESLPPERFTHKGFKYIKHDYNQ